MEEAEWEANYVILQQHCFDFKKIELNIMNGTTQTPFEKKLVSWVNNQRCRKDCLTQCQYLKLNDLVNRHYFSWENSFTNDTSSTIAGGSSDDVSSQQHTALMPMTQLPVQPNILPSAPSAQRLLTYDPTFLLAPECDVENAAIRHTKFGNIISSAALYSQSKIVLPIEVDQAISTIEQKSSEAEESLQSSWLLSSDLVASLPVPSQSSANIGGTMCDSSCVDQQQLMQKDQTFAAAPNAKCLLLNGCQRSIPNSVTEVSAVAGAANNTETLQPQLARSPQQDHVFVAFAYTQDLEGISTPQLGIGLVCNREWNENRTLFLVGMSPLDPLAPFTTNYMMEFYENITVNADDVLAWFLEFTESGTGSFLTNKAQKRIKNILRVFPNLKFGSTDS